MKKLLFVVVALGLSTGFAKDEKKSEKKIDRKPNQESNMWHIKSMKFEDGRSLMGLMYDEGQQVSDKESIYPRLYQMKVLCSGGYKIDNYRSACWIERLDKPATEFKPE